jgi:L-lactate dehydrogenase complex protein LldF
VAGRSEFGHRIDAALGNTAKRANIARAMYGLQKKRLAAFPDPDALESLRDAGEAIKRRALAALPELLEQLEANCRRNGIEVHWAETVEDANGIVLRILRGQGARSLIKGKSMVSEEMGLNHALEHEGIEALESDLGEFIIQLAGEGPSHIIAPAVHKSRHEVAALFGRMFPDLPRRDDIEGLCATAREILRRKFFAADAGLSGANFLVAETGTIVLVENEGNGRLCTTAPRVHIAVTGIEKLVERMADLPPLLKLLTRSATGQPITTYVNFISGPRKAGERDGPREVHLVLLDNGRSRIYEDRELRDSLRCIRCGACMNHCPVYVRLGGHAYGTVYPGPIGTVLEPQRSGLDRLGELAEASTLCGACSEVCPVRIPLPALISRLRFDGVRADAGPTRGSGGRRSRRETLVWRLWARLNSSPRLYRLWLAIATRLRGLAPRRIAGWSDARELPRPAARSLHVLARELGFSDE